MFEILSRIFNWLVRQALTLLVILAVLVGWAWMQGELKRAEQLEKEHAGLATQQDALSREIAELKRGALQRFQKSQFVESVLSRKSAERQRLWEEHFWTRMIPGSDAWTNIKVLDLEIAGYQKILRNVAHANESGSTKLDALERTKLEIDRQIATVEATLAKSYASRLAAVLRQQLPIAMGVLVGILLVPIGIKVLFYYVVAPWAAGRPPIRLLPSASGGIASASAEGTAGSDRGKMSAVSQPVVLRENQELLIQPEYLQSTSLQAEKRTRWLLNPRIPFSSLLSGMYMLTRVGPAGAEPVVISATKDPLSEVGVIDLADGAAFVCQPRSLAGVIQDCDHPIRITRHWRLGSLHAWLTLQLRFLVFHGPGQLVMKGCRGIRIESAGTGRLINQAATLGFSANLDYANTRCETFVSYWTGKEDLFNDLFTGGSGVYVYEEMPDLKRTTGVGRHLEGFTDALLKIFGV